MKIQLPVVYSQFDPQWSKQLLGNNTDPHFNFYNYACLVASFAAVARYYGKQETPVTLNEKLKQIGGYPAGSGEYINGKFQELFPDLQESSFPTPDLLTDEQIQEIKSALDQGFPVIVGIDYNPKTLTFDSHFSILVDYDPNDENNFTIADTLGGRTHSLKDYLSGQIDTARKLIWKYFIIKGTVPQKPENRPVEAVQPAGGGLPANYGDIIHNSGEWEELSRKFAPEIEPKNIDSVSLEDRIRKQLPVETKEVEVIKEVIKEVPVEKIVEVASEGSSGEKWAQTVEYLELGKPASEASADDVKRVVAGIKSRQTDLENKAREAQKNAAEKETTISNLNEDISRLKKEVTQNEKLHKAQIDSLKKTQPNFDSVTRQFGAVIADLKSELQAKIDEVKQLRIDLSAQVVDSQDAQMPSGSIKGRGGLIAWISRYLNLKW